VKQLVTRAHVELRASGGKLGDAPGQPPAVGPGQGPVIEGEFERLEEKATRPHRGKDRDRL
jgi:hypothetical protein